MAKIELSKGVQLTPEELGDLIDFEISEGLKKLTRCRTHAEQIEIVDKISQIISDLKNHLKSINN